MSLDDIKDSIISAGKFVSNTASTATSKASIKLSIKSKEDVLEKEYAKIGKEYFNSLNKKDKTKYKNIIDLEEEISKLNNELDILNKAKECSKCGTKVTKDIKYCAECGTKID